MLRIPKFTISYFVRYYAATKFEELALATEEIEDTIESFLAFHVVERSFKLEQSSFQEGSTTTLPMSTSKDHLFIYSILRILNL